MSLICQKLHELAGDCLRHQFPYDGGAIPSNGLYLLFEEGELGHSSNRIVRIGTHTGQGRLSSRLREHFLVENKDRSIFRKNIGRALLAKDRDPFLSDWELDLTTKKARELHSDRIDRQRQDEVERRVTSYIQKAFSFVVLPIQEKQERLRMESRIISTVSLCGDCKASSGWLGQYSPKDQIRQSGLWLVQGLYKEPLSNDDMEHLREIAS